MVWWSILLWALLKLVIAFLFIFITALILIWLLRKIMGHMQYRRGPRHHGPHGIWQTVFDTIKLLGKEDIIPTGVDRWTFIWAPMIIFVPSLMAFVFLPFAEKIVATNIEISLFFVLAIMGLSIIALLMAGWGSNNKYALLGGVRSAAQMMSYEIPMLISAMGVVMMSGSMNLSDIVRAQQHIWYIVPQLVGFFIFGCASLAEINSTPFDIPEAESEIVSGFNVEYSGFQVCGIFPGRVCKSFYSMRTCRTSFSWRVAAVYKSGLWYDFLSCKDLCIDFCSNVGKVYFPEIQDRPVYEFRLESPSAALTGKSFCYRDNCVNS